MAVPTAKQYILDFENMGLGMFVHWGLYSQPGRGEWVYDLAIIGDENVTVDGKYKGAYAFDGITDEIESIKWLDNDEEISFISGKGMLACDFVGQPYGTSYPVRVAKAVIK